MRLGLCEVVHPLLGVREVIAVGVVESRGGQHTLHHGQVLLVHTILRIEKKIVNYELELLL